MPEVELELAAAMQDWEKQQRDKALREHQPGCNMVLWIEVLGFWLPRSPRTCGRDD